MTEPVSAQRSIPDFAALVVTISEVHRALAEQAVSYHPRELSSCRAFYIAYSEIRGTLSPESQ